MSEPAVAPRQLVPWLMRLTGYNMWVVSADPNGHAGKGQLDVTTDPSKARRFASLDELFNAWRAQSTVLPLRPDGRPNRPLTAFTIEPVSADRVDRVNWPTPPPRSAWPTPDEFFP